MTLTAAFTAFTAFTLKPLTSARPGIALVRLAVRLAACLTWWLICIHPVAFAAEPVADPPDRAGTPADLSRAAAPFDFALIGDLPYDPEESVRFDALLAHINADASVQLVLHAGDIKGSSESCGDTLLRQRHAQLTQLRPPLVYTPGDNEWTDCHRRRAGAFNPIERLRFLRKLFFPRPTVLSILPSGGPGGIDGGGGAAGAGAPLRHPQSADPRYAEFVENGWFMAGGVVFATVHVVGSNNGLEPWVGLDAHDHKRAPRKERIDEVARRGEAAVAWLDRVFAAAERERAAGVVVLMQANPRFEDAPDDPNRAGFNAILSTLQRHARAFGRPVLLAHGDEHRFLVDKPFAADDGTGVNNLTRVQTFGSPRVRWVKVTVDARQPNVFTVVAKPDR